MLVWDASSGDTVTAIPVGQLIEALAFSHDGERLVTAAGKQAVVWDAATGRQLSEPMEHARTIKAVSFSPGDDFILTASRDTTARVWFASTGLPATDPLPHKRTVQTAAFSPDGRLIVTASDDGSAQVWDFFSLRPATGILEGMAEAIGGMRINTEGALVPLEGRISALDSLSVACRDEVGPYVVLCRELIGSAVGASASGSK